MAADELPEFEYEGKEPLQLERLIHSLLVESSKTKSLLPECLTRRVCENMGIECNEDTFFNLLGAMAEYSLNETIQSIRSVQTTNPTKTLTTKDVKKTLETMGINIGAPRVIPEMGISLTEQNIYHPEDP